MSDDKKLTLDDFEGETNPEKPLLFADERHDTERFDPELHRGGLDPSRIPGYSEIVMANDIAKADPLIFRDRNGVTKEEMYAKIGAKPMELPVEFKWLPTSAAGGDLSSSQARALDRYRTQEGFRPAVRDDIERHGFKMPPLGREAEDGTIRRGADTALFVRSGEVARKWEAFNLRNQQEMEGIHTPDSEAPDAFLEWQERESITVTH